jgi:uncharacterized membrane protein
MSALANNESNLAGRRGLAIAANRAIYWLVQHWIVVFVVAAGLYVGLPWLAPVLMQLGWTWGANLIYAIYSTQCHQLPQRSYFLFGPQAMYSLAEIQAVTGPTDNPLLLRQFTGNAQMGWKVAWSDRMVSMYTGVLLIGVLYWPLRRRVRALPWQAFALFVLPMVVDGLTHMVSDLAGLGQGFRDSNAWLAALTNHAFPASFYAGDSLGSFNSWMRHLTGFVLALGVVWLAFPYLQQAMADTAAQIEAKFQRADLSL